MCVCMMNIFVVYMIFRTPFMVVEMAEQESFNNEREDMCDTSFIVSSNLRDIWINYVKEKHLELLSLSNKFADEILAIYDYFVHCYEADDNVSGCVMEFFLYEKQLDGAKDSKLRGHHQKPNVDVLNAMATSESSIREHPIVTEYFEFFYRKAFVVSVIFLLVHLLFLILLNGYALSTRNKYSYSSDTNKVSCSWYAQCKILTVSFFPFQFVDAGHVVCRRSNCSTPVKYSIFDETQCITPVPSIDKVNNGACFLCLLKTTVREACYNNDYRYTYCPLVPENKKVWWWVHMHYPVVFMAAFGIARECIQILMDPRDYMSDWFQNIVELSMYTLALIFGLNFSECPYKDAYKHIWQFLLGVLAVALSW